MMWLTELIETLIDAAKTGDLRGHLRAWWWTVWNVHLLDTPLWTWE